jgi:Na+-transporting methylmalonyl-CoA/oxaloacetate decarboxylase gamma subunit
LANSAEVGTRDPSDQLHSFDFDGEHSMLGIYGLNTADSIETLGVITLKDDCDPTDHSVVTQDAEVVSKAVTPTSSESETVLWGFKLEAVVGIGIGVVFLILILLVCVFWICCICGTRICFSINRRRALKSKDSAHVKPSMSPKQPPS